MADLPNLPSPAVAGHRPTDHGERLWTPWRMRYIGGEAKEHGCLFCNRLAADDDVASLILWRGDRCFAIMNLYPYNTGHVMLVPNAHVASPEAAEPETLADLAMLLPVVLRALRQALHCDGFNVGLNVGAIAGAGVAEHLHQHVVPRWAGDANFMPILAATMVLPELIPVTYAKLRAEIEREAARLAGDDPGEVGVVLRGTDRQPHLAEPAATEMVATARADEPLWRAAARLAVEAAGGAVVLVGWAGSRHAGDGAPVLAFAPEPAARTDAGP